ncbi:MAG: AmpG family muropeptide MFS transporter [Chromatiales bacterium]|nr:AmpG family muropeptide MFS transporter [Chromatiales bacterium]
MALQSKPSSGRPWQDILFNRRNLICIFQGFSSGLPLYVLVTLVPAWLRTAGIDLSTIGLLSLVTLPYTLKFAWAPLLDRYRPPFLGRRRGWTLITQILLLVSIGMLGAYQPADSIQSIAFLMFAISLFSATQDVALDAYRREMLADDELGIGNSFFINTYRLSGFISGSLALILSDTIPWGLVYWIVAGFMLVGIVTTFVVTETADDSVAPQSLRAAVIEPFIEFFSRDGWRSALLILAFIVFYKLGDSMATALQTPFFLDLNFTRTEIGLIVKVATAWSSIAGTALGGFIMLKTCINRALWLFGVVQIITILGFALLAQLGHNPIALFFVVSAEYLGVGLGGVALAAFMAKQTSMSFTATQLALLTSVAAISRTFANATTGYVIEAIGYFNFFLFCMLLAVPGMLLLFRVAPWSEPATGRKAF